ncbi:uncharacterized protein LOC129574433 [Sitodiplosis mosellana]|uniref:uncharacterized protein LOC129574433 n=1 Tax=Sitodiplosis mosellana TaxID=263140 RepID=UPI002443DA70|nr:uncharacterized protein LOC129574433 [Sitodiplosis mosellana]
MFISWLSILSAISVATALPVSVYPVRPYVFLAPELPKFALQPTVKVQSPATIQQIQPVPLTKSESAPTRQYVVVYPSYQYVTTRQDDSSNAGFFETIQNYFINFGNGLSQSDDASQIMDAIEPDKPQTAAATSATSATTADATKSIFAPEPVVSQEKITPTPSESKQKFFYSYLTPASTVPLNSDRRLFFLGDQPQVFGSFSGSALNPVFNLQQVPVVLSSRSNVAQPDDPQPNKVISENVQKFSQIPPVMATVEQTPQVEGKSNSIEPTDSVVVDAVPENRVVPTFQPVEDNRALPVVSTEATVLDDKAPVVADVVPSVIVARSNPIPLAVSGDPVVSSSAVASSVVPSFVVDGVVGGVVEGNESVQQTVVSPSLKEVEPAVVPPAVVSSIVADQTVQGSPTVESVTSGSV